MWWSRTYLFESEDLVPNQPTNQCIRLFGFGVSLFQSSIPVRSYSSLVEGTNRKKNEYYAEGHGIVSRYSSGDSSKLTPTRVVFGAAALILFLFIALARLNSQASPAPTTERAAIYAHDPNDPWNRIFFCLFTRTVKTRLAAELDAGSPSTRIQYVGFPHDLAVSTRLSERVEIGDRAIEPLYPSFITSQGVSQVLSEPLFSHLKQALTDALEEETPRPPLERALMQSDLWAAYDLIFQNSHFTGGEGQWLRERIDQLLPLLARLIKRLGLAQNEIAALPDNYAAASVSAQLPGLFDPGSGWLEVQWRPQRTHDHSAGYRRAARVFVKPTAPPTDKPEFLNSLRNAPGIVSKLEAVALVIQDLLIQSDGKVVPSRLTFDVQLRRFIRNERGALIGTGIGEYELSRRLLLTKPASGGLVSLDEKAPVYLPEAGNDYGFASLQRNQHEVGLPVLVMLRTRCIACHGQDIMAMFTFNTNLQPAFPPVDQLNPLAHEHALYVAQRKMESVELKALSEQERTR